MNKKELVENIAMFGIFLIIDGSLMFGLAFYPELTEIVLLIIGGILSLFCIYSVYKISWSNDESSR